MFELPAITHSFWATQSWGVGQLVNLDPDLLLTFSLETAGCVAQVGAGETRAVELLEAGGRLLSKAIFKADPEIEGNAKQMIGFATERIVRQPQLYNEVCRIYAREMSRLLGADSFGSWDAWLRLFGDPQKILLHVEFPFLTVGKRSIQKRAIEKGYGFPSAVKYCLEVKNPLRRARAIEARIKYFEEHPFEVKKFSDLNVIDKIALYAVSKKRFEQDLELQEKPYYYVGSEFPSFGKFMQYLEMVLSVPGLQLAAGVTAHYSKFLWMAVTNYHAITVELDITNDWFENIRTPFDALYSVYRKYKGTDSLVPNLKKSFHLLYLSQDWSVISHFLEALEKRDAFRDQDDLLLMGDLRDPFGEELIGGPEIIGLSRHYSQDPYLRKSWSDLSESEQIALHLAVKSLFFKRVRSFGRFPDSVAFHLYMKYASRILQISGKPVSLEGLVDDMQKISMGIPFFSEDHQEFFKTMVDKPSVISDEDFLRIREVLLKGNPRVTRFFVRSVCFRSSPGEGMAALELAERGWFLEEGLFWDYTRDPHREEKLGKLEDSVLELLEGRRNPNLEDPFDLLALLAGIRIWNREIEEVLEKVVIPPAESGLEDVDETFEVMLQQRSAHENLGKDEISTKIREIHRYRYFTEVLAKILSEFKSLPLKVQELVTKQFQADSGESFAEQAANMMEEEAKIISMDILKEMIKIKKWHPKMMEILILAITLNKQEESVQRAVSQLASYHDETSAENVIKTLYAIEDFFTEHVKNTWEEYFPDKALPSSFLKGLRPLLKRVRINNIAPVRVRIRAERDPLGALSFYVADNCLARPDYAIYNMQDPGYVPLRLLIEGEEAVRQFFEDRIKPEMSDDKILAIRKELTDALRAQDRHLPWRWRGIIQTYSRRADIRDAGWKTWENKKILIVAGIDPQLDLYVDGGELIQKLREMFLRLAAEKGYDMVVIPYPEGMQSSRRIFVIPEINKILWMKPIIRVKNAIGFPRKGGGESDKAFYHDQKQDKFIVFISEDEIKAHTSPDNPTRRPRKKIP